MRSIIKPLITISFCAALAACSMDEIPQSSVDKDAIFGTESGLKTYSYSFYNMLPSVTDGYKKDEMCDYGAVSNYNDFIRKDAYSSTKSSGWSWGDLRNINYFIVNCTNEAISQETRNHYIGLARFFRAYFYYNKVVRFGDVPWIDHPLDVDSPELYAPRDSRTVVMDHVLEDLDFACQNITHTSDETGSLVTKWVAYALKSRICLFEGTFRKYHTELNLASTADKWLEEAYKAADVVMKESGHSLYTAEGVDASFRALFISDTPITSEVMLASCADEKLGVLGSANWWWTSGTYGPRFSMIRPFINLFLMTDGTPFTDKPNHEKIEFYEECQNRDTRLAQTIRTPGYKVDGVEVAPNFNGYSYTGYQPIKFVQDQTCAAGAAVDNGKSTNDIPVYRLAGVMLDFAEAKAELGSLTQNDLDKSINKIRDRAGMPHLSLEDANDHPDPYLSSADFGYPNVTGGNKGVILEIRRERAVELAQEGYRYFDLIRWKAGPCIDQDIYGMYFPGPGLYDLSGDGEPDICIFDNDYLKPTSWTGPAFKLGEQMWLSEGNKGYVNYHHNITHHFNEERDYYYPIPINDRTLNKNLTQNPGWNDGLSY